MSQLIKLLIVVSLLVTATQTYSLARTKPTAEEVKYEDVKALEHNTTVLLMDVRQPSELEETGVIPGAVNIPLNELETALTLPDNEFSEKYKREKPQTDTPMVFYCTVGVRSTQASNIALDLGFTNVKNYKGSWNDWEQHLKEENALSKSI